MLLFLLGGIQGVLVVAYLASGMIVDTRNEENLIVFVGIRFLAGITSLIIAIANGGWRLGRRS